MLRVPRYLPTLQNDAQARLPLCVRGGVFAMVRILD